MDPEIGCETSSEVSCVQDVIALCKTSWLRDSGETYSESLNERIAGHLCERISRNSVPEEAFPNWATEQETKHGLIKIPAH